MIYHEVMRIRIATLMLVWAVATFGAADDSVSFNRDVRPILSDKCFHCHGPDTQNRQADLRLDDRQAAIDSGAIEAGKPDESELVRRILSTDDEERMPPASSKLERLTDAEIATLRRWIAQGAKYEPHWAFIAPRGGKQYDAASAIDSVVAAGLAKRQLAMQPQADRATLVRRLSFDLTGLPPTAAEVEAFLADDSPGAYEKLVDRLLASKHYGERMTVDWLDVARYADSYGFQVDRERDVWPWRDWVIDAFNRNLPFDQFITWQLAGDLLPGATDEQILATAFNRLHQQECEGGSVEEEYRVEYVCDRVQTFATAFLGLTFECSRCHDHKFDPITQREYYQLFAMFQNIDEAGLYSFFTHSVPTPTLVLNDANSKGELQKLAGEVDRLAKQTTEVRNSRRAAFDAWLAELRTASAAKSDGDPLPSLDGDIARFRFETLKGTSLANDIDRKRPAKLRGQNRLVPGKSGQAIEFTGDDPVDLPLGNFDRHEPFSIALWLKTPDVKERAVVFHRSRAWTDAGSRGYELLIENGRLKWSLIHFWPGNAISIAAKEPLPLNEWVHVVVSSDGSSRAEGLTLSVNGSAAPAEIVRDNLTRTIQGGGGDEIALGERFRDRGFKQGAIDDFRVFARALSELEVEAAWRGTPLRELMMEKLAGSKDSASTGSGSSEAVSSDAATREPLFDAYLAAVDPAWSEHLKMLQAARAKLNAAAEGSKEIMVMRELPQPKRAYVLFRGEYSERRDEVQPGTPAVLPPFPQDAPRNRLGLARWLTDRNHPLTARVTVNRVWQGLFGRGLVKTAEDFGSQGARPSYPEVLDALAAGFIESGWDMKRLLKTIVMSQTYRQRSLASEQTMADDPENEWLARGPRLRLPAEMIRDSALVAAGLLDRQFGGPPVNPYEMAESFKPNPPKGDNDVYRRSLYTNWRRTGPPPAMISFDAPRRAVCTAKRERTDSPLQALILLNGVQYVEAARVLGETLHLEAKGDLEKMIEQGCLRCLSRRPDARETEILTGLYREQLAHFESHPDEAKKLLAIGRRARNENVPLAEAAAATVLSQALLSHDGSIVKR